MYFLGKKENNWFIKFLDKIVLFALRSNELIEVASYNAKKQ
jgi:hypothetical protein